MPNALKLVIILFLGVILGTAAFFLVDHLVTPDDPNQPSLMSRVQQLFGNRKHSKTKLPGDLPPERPTASDGTKEGVKGGIALPPIAPGVPAGTPMAGYVYRILGQAIARFDDTPRILKKGAPVFVGDNIITGDNIKVMLSMTDGTALSLGDRTEFEIEEFHYKASEQTGQATLLLNQGVFRSVTGKIGELENRPFEVKTPIATIGIRGTDFFGRFARRLKRLRMDALLLKGAIVVKTALGEQVIDRAEFGVTVDSIDGLPSRPERWSREDIRDILQRVYIPPQTSPEDLETGDGDGDASALEDKLESLLTEDVSLDKIESKDEEVECANCTPDPSPAPDPDPDTNVAVVCNDADLTMPEEGIGLPQQTFLAAMPATDADNDTITYTIVTDTASETPVTPVYQDDTQERLIGVWSTGRGPISLVHDTDGDPQESNTTGKFTFAPGKDWYGVQTFKYQATDYINDSCQGTITITVTNVPDIPYCAEKPTPVIAENCAHQPLNLCEPKDGDPDDVLTAKVEMIPDPAKGFVMVKDGSAALAVGDIIPLSDLPNVQFEPLVGPTEARWDPTKKIYGDAGNFIFSFTDGRHFVDQDSNLSSTTGIYINAAPLMHPSPTQLYVDRVKPDIELYQGDKDTLSGTATDERTKLIYPHDPDGPLSPKNPPVITVTAIPDATKGFLKRYDVSQGEFIDIPQFGELSIDDFQFGRLLFSANQDGFDGLGGWGEAGTAKIRLEDGVNNACGADGGLHQELSFEVVKCKTANGPDLPTALADAKNQYTRIRDALATPGASVEVTDEQALSLILEKFNRETSEDLNLLDFLTEAKVTFSTVSPTFTLAMEIDQISTLFAHATSTAHLDINSILKVFSTHPATCVIITGDPVKNGSVLKLSEQNLHIQVGDAVPDITLEFLGTEYNKNQTLADQFFNQTGAAGGGKLMPTQENVNYYFNVESFVIGDGKVTLTAPP